MAALQREVATLRSSVQAKETALANALEVGSGQVQELQAARQELLLKLETAEHQMQVRSTATASTGRHWILWEVKLKHS